MPNRLSHLYKRLTRRNTRIPIVIPIVAPESDPYIKRLKNLALDRTSLDSQLSALPRYYYLPLKNSIESKGNYAYIHNKLHKYIHSGMNPSIAVDKSEADWKRLKKTKSTKELKKIENEAIYDLKHDNFKEKSFSKISRTKSLPNKKSYKSRTKSKTKRRPRTI
jgi:hypothetical protein